LYVLTQTEGWHAKDAAGKNRLIILNSKDEKVSEL